MNNKFIVIGLDGATFDILESPLREGRLPNIKRMMDMGAVGKMKSTIPFHSAPAWTTMVTGTNPGRHGIFDFFKINNDRLEVISSYDRKEPALWDILTENSKKSIVINVPCTYPPKKIFGKMITGMLTPSKDSDFTYPPELKNKLTDYSLDSWWQALPFYFYSAENSCNLLKITENIVVERFNLIERLSQDNNWDVIFMVVRIMDHLQHYMYSDKEMIIKAYETVDIHIGKLFERYPNDNIFIVSDHGFRAAKRVFYINNFLYNRGYIKIRRGSIALSIIKNCIFNIIKTAAKLTSKIFDIDSLSRKSYVKKFLNKYSFSIKKYFKNSSAYSPSASSCGIFLNDKSKKDEIIRKLKKLEDSSGANVLENVYEPTDIFEGNEVVNAPDIIYIVNKDYTMSDRLSSDGLKFRDIFKKQINLKEIQELSSGSHSGEHARDGIFIASGENIKKTKLEGMIIEDFLPTILYGMNLGRAKNLDGNIQNIYKHNLNDKELEIKKKIKKNSKKDNHDIDKIKERLKNLGYIT